MIKRMHFGKCIPAAQYSRLISLWYEAAICLDTK